MKEKREICRNKKRKKIVFVVFSAKEREDGYKWRVISDIDHLR